MYAEKAFAEMLLSLLENPLLMVRSIIALENDNKKPLIRQWNC